MICLIRCSIICSNPKWLTEGIVEKRVRDKSTWIVWFLGRRVEDQGRTGITSFQGAKRNCFTLKLPFINRLDISSVVLVEIGESVVEEDWCREVVGNLKFESADSVCVVSDGLVYGLPAG